MQLNGTEALEIARTCGFRLTAIYGHGSVRIKSIRNRQLPELEVTVSSERNYRENLDVGADEYVLLRETLGVWHALACCCDYGSYENLRFWDEVVNEFMDDFVDFEEAERTDFHDEVVSSLLGRGYADSAVCNREFSRASIPGQLVFEWRSCGRSAGCMSKLEVSSHRHWR